MTGFAALPRLETERLIPRAWQSSALWLIGRLARHHSNGAV